MPEIPKPTKKQTDAINPGESSPRVLTVTITETIQPISDGEVMRCVDFKLESTVDSQTSEDSILPVFAVALMALSKSLLRMVAGNLIKAVEDLAPGEAPAPVEVFMSEALAEFNKADFPAEIDPDIEVVRSQD